MGINLEALTLLAYEYTPFFFAVLLVTFMGKHAYHAYSNASPENSQTYRWFFIVAYTVGLILVIATSVWWFMHPPSHINPQPRIYYFEGKISGLQEYEEIASDDLYFQSYTPNTPSTPEGIKKRDEKFLIVRDGKPFDDKDIFIVYFQKQGKKEQELLSIKYKLGEKPIYKVFYDRKKDKHVLKLISPEQTRSSMSLLESVFFQTAYAQETQNVHMDSGITSSSKDVKQRVIEELQDERTPVGEKIDLLQSLGKETDRKLGEYLKRNTIKETMILTILDLSRHTDAQLAAYSQKLINRFDLASYVSDELQSEDQQRLENVYKLLARIEGSQRKTLLSAVKKSGVKVPNRFDATKSRVLIPTGSLQGDRYYVRASWNWSIPQKNQGQDRNTFNCLTEVFNNALGKKKTLKKERIEMEQLKGKRFIYGYSKQWALRFVDRIVACGGKATFVNGITLKVPATPKS